MTDLPVPAPASRRVAALIAEGFDWKAFEVIRRRLVSAGAQVKTVAPRLGRIDGDGGAVEADFTLLGALSSHFDAVVVPGTSDDGAEGLREDTDAERFVSEAYRSCKPFAVFGTGAELLSFAGIVASRAPLAGRSLVLVGDSTEASEIGAAMLDAIA